MKHKYYPIELKQQVIDDYLSGNYSTYDLTRKYNIPNSTIKNWYYDKFKQGVSLDDRHDLKGRKKEENIDYKERYEILKKYQVFLKAQRERK